MTGIELLVDIIGRTDRYNLHSHSEFCDGRASIAEIAAAALREGFEVWGVSPHSPIPVESPCNMDASLLPRYLDVMQKLKEEYAGRMQLLTSLEIDWLGPDYGPHIDRFQKLPLDYRIGSVHFVPNQEGRYLDCDGSFERFSRYLNLGYGGDLRYVVEKYFEMVLTMIETGGFDLLGHFDKVIGNAAQSDPTLEDRAWYAALIDDVIDRAAASGVVVEINTKAIHTLGRFFPAERWWPKLCERNIPLAVNSDCHYTDRTNLGRTEALAALNGLANLNDDLLWDRL